MNGHHADSSQNIVHTGLEIGSGLVFREVKKVWKVTAKAEKRLELLKCLQEKNLGLAEDEYQARKQAKSYHSNKFKLKSTRDSEYIRRKMELRVRDAYQALREASKEQSIMRKKVSSITLKRPRLQEKIFAQLERDINSLREQIEKKNRIKIAHLEKKFLTEQHAEGTLYPNVPEHLTRFKDIKLYTVELSQIDTNVTVDVDVIGDVKLDEEELCVFRLPPNFAVLDKLSVEEFTFETEMAMTKTRWEKRKILGEQLDEPVEVSAEDY